jgi:hypothetical protein
MLECDSFNTRISYEQVCTEMQKVIEVVLTSPIIIDDDDNECDDSDNNNNNNNNSKNKKIHYLDNTEKDTTMGVTLKFKDILPSWNMNRIKSVSSKKGR